MVHMLLYAQFSSSSHSNLRPLPETFVKVASCKTCDCAICSPRGRVSLGGGRLTLGKELSLEGVFKQG